MFGAPIGSGLCYMTIMLMNFFFIAKHIGFFPDLKNVLLKPFVASVFCAGAAIGSYKLFIMLLGARRIIVIPAILVAAIVYVIVIFLIKAITKEDIMLLPKGKKIYSILLKLHLMKCEEG